MAKLSSIAELEEWSRQLGQGEGQMRVHVCTGTACRSAGSLDVATALEHAMSREGLSFPVFRVGCQGLCEHGPLLTIEGMDNDPEKEIFYQFVQPFDAPKIADLTLKRGQLIDRLLYDDPITGSMARTRPEIPFFQEQARLVLERCGQVDPPSVEQYVATGGYRALAKMLGGMTPEAVVDEVKRSGLRGRGGAGFPTGVKWEVARNASGARKLVMCNGDEGDPGAFMDRSIMEGDPHAVLEGMMICAYAIGNCSEGIIYVRQEYPLALQNLQKAIEFAREKGFLGENILGTDFSFDVRINRGAGAFVCGEETALMNSVMGLRGTPRVRPPFPVESGAWGLPTCLNNVETLANVPLIITRSADWYASMGTEGSKGTKVFALSGDVNGTGLIEVPMGTTVRDVVFKIGGGVRGGKKFKLAQVGGPSGGCLTSEHLDLPIDYESLRGVGSIMGSGGLVVVDEDTCAVQLARYFLSFTQRESCGKCPPCRIGTYEMLKILDRIMEGQGQEGDIERLEDLGRKIIQSSLCGLGMTAPNPVLTTIRYFRSEYEAHIHEKRCPTGECQLLRRYDIDQGDCIRCGLCLEACKDGAIKETTDSYFIEDVLCTRCGSCAAVCPTECI